MMELMVSSGRNVKAQKWCVGRQGEKRAYVGSAVGGKHGLVYVGCGCGCGLW